MIKPINFMGKVYFSDSVKKTIDPSHKKRIEQYAAKKPSDMSIYVVGQQVGYIYELNGIKYTPEQCKIVDKDNKLKIEVDTPEGKVAVMPSEIEVKKPLSIYNSYIVSELQKNNIDYLPDRKQFCFSPCVPYKSTIIDPKGIEHPDKDF